MMKSEIATNFLEKRVKMCQVHFELQLDLSLDRMWIHIVDTLGPMDVQKCILLIGFGNCNMFQRYSPLLFY